MWSVLLYNDKDVLFPVDFSSVRSGRKKKINVSQHHKATQRIKWEIKEPIKKPIQITDSVWVYTHTVINLKCRCAFQLCFWVGFYEMSLGSPKLVKLHLKYLSVRELLCRINFESQDFMTQIFAAVI